MNGENKRHSIINVLSNAIINKNINWDNVNINFVFGQGKKNILKKSIKALHRLDKEEETSIKLNKIIIFLSKKLHCCYILSLQWERAIN